MLNGHGERRFTTGSLKTVFPVATPELLSFNQRSIGPRWEDFDELKNGEYELTFFADSKCSTDVLPTMAGSGSSRLLNKLTWDNAAIVSPATTKKLGIQDEDLLRLRAEGVELSAALVVPGQPTGSISIAIGYGRTQAGFVGGYTELGVAQQVVVDVQPLR